MLPPEFESIAADLRTRFRAAVAADRDADRLPDLLAVEEVVVAFVRELGQGLLQDFVSVRERQAKASRGPCSCGRRTTWTRKTMLGPVTVGIRTRTAGPATARSDRCTPGSGRIGRRGR